ncbi:unnamed protein product [Phyllotreta striolata]|uniref:Transmembrane protein 62 n=1 Tax=Phyllotreta striolata TaxID=444603 RepID=A0A9N9THF1_PHYSR|nr:unnamed protein product [Phyllotreta striolata]
MGLTKITVGILISMVLFAIFFTHVVNVLSTSPIQKEVNKDHVISFSDSSDNLLWILQISDIHISLFRDPMRITEFREFCHLTLNAIKPSVVLASGDLTDAKTKDSIGSEQYEEEWKHYRDILNESNIKKRTLWLDIRGNHDNFNVGSPLSKQNFFTNYSIQGRDHPRSYRFQIKKRNNIYTFIGIDACLEPGPRRPFNFIGHLDDDEIKEIRSLIEQTESQPNNYTIFFGHFPTSCILSPSQDNIRDIMGSHKQGLAYVCGHLHKLGGLIPKMYTLQKTGFLELELGDWKDNRVYRLLAIDHGILSFTDMVHRHWPVVLITNPKDALFYNPARENLDILRNSTHIRILAFSLSTIEYVKVQINNEGWLHCKKTKGSLFVSPWNPKKYLTGLHSIEVLVRDVEGREKYENQLFSLDGTKLSFGILPKIALMSDVSIIFRSMFFITLCLSIVPLFAIRYIHKLVAGGKMIKPKLRQSCCFSLLQKVWVMCTIDRMFWPIVLYPIYLAVGPWTIGYIVEDHLGSVFAWGILVNNAYLPGAFTYVYGFIQLITFQIPITFIVAKTVYFRFLEITVKTGKGLSLKNKIVFHFPFSVVFVMQVIMAYLFWLAYGTTAFLLGPLRTWSLILAAVLYWQALNLPEKCTRKAAEIWYVSPSSSAANQDNINRSSLEKSN